MTTPIQYYGTGKRKSAVARIFLRPGDGAVTVNNRTLESFFPNPLHRMTVNVPLNLTETTGRFAIKVTVCGGGNSGQADAIRHGISRALLQFNPELRGMLKAKGLLTRDSRIKERKKPGQPGARKRFQFSKR